MKYRFIHFFSVYWDLLFFIFPLTLALMINYNFQYDLDKLAEQSLVYFFLIKYISDAGHVMSTYYLFIKNPAYPNRLDRKIWQIPLLAVSISYFVFVMNTKTFETTLGYIALSHVVMQQYGWLRISLQNKTSVRLEKFSYYLAFIGVTLLPILYWHTGASNVSPSYFYRENIQIFLPISSAKFFVFLHWVFLLPMVLIVVIRLLKERLINLGTLYCLFSAWTIFYLGLVYVQSKSFFWIILIITHGWGYHFHILKNVLNLKKIQSSDSAELVISKFFINWFFTVCILAGCWYYFMYTYKTQSWVIPLLWSPLIIHYAFDSVIWKKNFLTSKSRASGLLIS